MVQGASQVDEQSHIKNEEVLRMQAFSRSLMVQILNLSKHLVESKSVIETLTKAVPTLSPDKKVNEDSTDGHTVTDVASEQQMLTEEKLTQLTTAHSHVCHLVRDTRERLHLLALDNSTNMENNDNKIVVGSLDKMTI